MAIRACCDFRDCCVNGLYLQYECLTILYYSLEDQQFLNFVVCLVQHSVLYRPISPYVGLTTSKSTDTVFHYVLSITCSLELLIFQFSAHSITGSGDWVGSYWS